MDKGQTLKKLPKDKRIPEEYLILDADAILASFNSSLHGLSGNEVIKRRKIYGLNQASNKKKRNILVDLVMRFLDPLVLVLLIIGLFSLIFGQKVNAILVLVMAALSVMVSLYQEKKASRDAEKLIDMVRVTCNVYRDGKLVNIPIKSVVPGDVVELAAGDIIPADLRVLHSRDLYVNQSAFTGESFPSEKHDLPLEKAESEISKLTNFCLMGSSVVSGRALGLIVQTGSNTEIGKVSRELSTDPPPTAFDKGINSFVMMMVRFMLILVVIVFVINMLTKANTIEAFLFALAVAVGLTPEMLPMMVAVNLSKGAIAMSRKEVIVKRLSSIQNFGAMNILCTDKTGTLTMDEIVLVRHLNEKGEEDEDVLKHAYINSVYQTGLNSILDKAILVHKHIPVRKYKKLDEIPYDFERRVMSVVVNMNRHARVITKGAPEEIIARSAYIDHGGGHKTEMDRHQKNRLMKIYANLSSDGFRVLALSYKELSLTTKKFGPEAEEEMVFKGFLAFLDPPKSTTKSTIADLAKLGVELKILSGDNELVTAKVCKEVGLEIKGSLNGSEISKMDERELRKAVSHVTIFCRLDPMQKERVIQALQANGNTVGFMGDGINDAPALKAADVGISVNNATGIAKETADIILLRKSLAVLKDCVKEGRKTFGNITKYIKMGSSSNFGNMFSMTGASIAIPFLPMMPTQILLNNFLYELSQASLPLDDVDEEFLVKPRPWNVDLIKKYMVLIGPISSLFDYLTFALMYFIFAANDPSKQALFQTGWFIESLTSQTLVMHVIRTNKIPFIQSWPNKLFMLNSLIILSFAYWFVQSKYAHVAGFVALPAKYFWILAGMMVLYLSLVQLGKVYFIKKHGSV